MDWNKPIKERQLKTWEVILVLLAGIILAALIVLNNKTFGLRGPNDNLIDADCKSRLHQIGNLFARAKENDSEALKGTTIPDLLREAAHGGKLDEKCLHCPANGAPYHVFSVPAALLFQRSGNTAPIPIVMDAPGAHGKLGANVLYSDGSIKRLPSEEVEKILAKFSSIPKGINPEVQNEAEP